MIARERIITKPQLGKGRYGKYGWYFEVEQRRMTKFAFDTYGPYWSKRLADVAREQIGGKR